MTDFSSLRAAQAANAYSVADAGFSPEDTSNGGDGGFGGLVENALNQAVAQGQGAEGQAKNAIAGHGDLTQVVTAVSQAELALQTTVAVRDRVLQAYQDIIKMSI